MFNFITWVNTGNYYTVVMFNSCFM